MDMKFSWKELVMQVVVCLILLLLTPICVFLFTHKIEDAGMILSFLSPYIVPCAIIFFFNFYLLLPRLFYKGKKLWFYISNILFIPLVKFNFLFDVFFKDKPENLPAVAWLGFTAVVFANILAYVATILIAWGLLNARRTNLLKQQLAEEKQRHAEAELMWLKNQINPHFLFNSLNNISSLVAIDVDRTQDCIASLSELLRYAMYESNKPSVPLVKEVEFMENYINLMSLRCSSKTSIKSVFDVKTKSLSIAPLLLISFIENAFKHGVSNSHPSFIDIHLSENDGILTFICENSNFPKSVNDHSGNGIGLQNMRRRMDILYPGRYDWEQYIANDVFHIKIQISLCERSDVR